MDVEAAIALHQAGRLDEAEAAYLGLLAGPARPTVLQLLALARVQQGRLAAALEAYDTLAVEGGADAAIHQARGDCLHALDRPADALAAYDAALALQPSHAAAHANRALVLLDLGRFDEAVAACDAALALTSPDAAVWTNRSAALRGAGDLDAARASADRALALRPGFADALNARGLALAAQNRFAEALESYEAALLQAPTHRGALNNAGVALTALGRFDDARGRHAAALAVDSGFAEAEYNLGLLDLRLGDPAGWRGLEARWRRRGERPIFPDATLWRGEPVEGLTVLLQAEQGLGDTLQFARYAPAVKARGARVVLRVQPPLVRLLSSLEGVDAVASEADPPPAFDRHIPLMSLPGLFGMQPMDRPYLAANADAVARWRTRLPTGLRVGLAWAGNPAHGNDRNRSVALQALTPLLARPATFVSLQRDVRAADAKVLVGSPILPWPDAIADFADTAALVAALDVVITVDTAVAHLAGGLGVETWMLLPHFPDWRWGVAGERTPWYPSLRLFRQPAFDRWSPVIEALSEALNEHLAKTERPRLA